jgi:hypothetical protein
MSYRERKRTNARSACERLKAADAVIDDATYLREAMNNKDITFDQALMALLIAELRDLNLVLEILNELRYLVYRYAAHGW